MRQTWLFKLLLLIDINIDNGNGAIVLIRIDIMNSMRTSNNISNIAIRIVTTS